MRKRTLIAIALISATVALPEVAQAQLSPGGIVGGITRPFREMLGRFGHFPRAYRHHGAPAMATAAPSNTLPGGMESHLGRVGPLAWPSAYEDVVGYTFWPDEYAPRLRGRGFDVIADTIAGSFPMPRAPARAATTGAGTRNDAAANATKDSCQDTSAVQDNWPAVRLGRTVQLSDTQREAAKKLQDAAAQSIKSLQTGCDASPSAPPDRLNTLVQKLWAARDAGIAIRAPLKDFDDSLTAAQKASFASRQPQASVPPPDARNTNGAVNAAMNRQYQACAGPNVEASERMIKQIELRVRPTNEQTASLENLHKASSDMAKLLMASCAKPIDASPLARLDAADDQLTAMNYAATTVQIAFNDFYGRLDEAQKARLESSGR